MVSRSHSNIATKRRQFLNLQTKRVDGKKKKLCVRCLKASAKHVKPKAKKETAAA